jgi:hypothetical protein
MRRSRIIASLVALAIAATLVGVALASQGGRPAKPPRTKPAVTTRMQRPTAPRRTTKKASPNAPRAKSVANTEGPDENTPGDPDDIQQGDQVGPDVGKESESEPKGEGETESNVESEQGQPGEPAVGHEDPPGQDVNHECTGDCVE